MPIFMNEEGNHAIESSMASVCPCQSEKSYLCLCFGGRIK